MWGPLEKISGVVETKKECSKTKLIPQLLQDIFHNTFTSPSQYKVNCIPKGHRRGSCSSFFIVPFLEWAPEASRDSLTLEKIHWSWNILWNNTTYESQGPWILAAMKCDTDVALKETKATIYYSTGNEWQALNESRRGADPAADDSNHTHCSRTALDWNVMLDPRPPYKGTVRT